MPVYVCLGYSSVVAWNRLLQHFRGWCWRSGLPCLHSQTASASWCSLPGGQCCFSMQKVKNRNTTEFCLRSFQGLWAAWCFMADMGGWALPQVSCSCSVWGDGWMDAGTCILHGLCSTTSQVLLYKIFKITHLVYVLTFVLGKMAGGLYFPEDLAEVL